MKKFLLFLSLMSMSCVFAGELGAFVPLEGKQSSLAASVLSPGSDDEEDPLFFPGSVDALLNHKGLGVIAVAQREEQSGPGIYPATLQAHIERMKRDAAEEVGRQTAKKEREAEQRGIAAGKALAGTDFEARLAQARKEGREAAESDAQEAEAARFTAEREAGKREALNQVRTTLFKGFKGPNLTVEALQAYHEEQIAKATEREVDSSVATRQSIPERQRGWSGWTVAGAGVGGVVVTYMVLQNGLMPGFLSK